MSSPRWFGSALSWRGRFSTRIVGIFLACVLLPIVLTSIFSYNHVVENLSRQAEANLKQQTKALAMSVVERLLFLEASLEMVAHTLREQNARATDFGSDDHPLHIASPQLEARSERFWLVQRENMGSTSMCRNRSPTPFTRPGRCERSPPKKASRRRWATSTTAVRAT